MDNIVQIEADFVESNTDFPELVSALQKGFASQEIIIPQRHHHDFPNPETGVDSTLLLMPAWYPGKNAGVKMVTINPENSRFDLPAIQGSYILMDATTGKVKAIVEAKSLTAKRTAAASALASSYLSKEDASTLMMIGTGALSKNLVAAHATVRPIKKVYVWGRNPEKAQMICDELKDGDFEIQAVTTIEEKVSEVDIISCATLSKTPLVLGTYIKPGQHIDLVGAYKPDMREANDETISKASIFVDTFDGLKESGDIAIPLEVGTLKKSAIKGDLFLLSSRKAKGRTSDKEITVFKSVGHALEDLVAATYYYNKFVNG